ncbi:DoxX family protein [uncultured Friedmanniella sp.]|uniref:DoxX family protein n=1 Tax=uncultured Friedmanniella sp. TaxID=335381 RepID=UPI0035CBEBB0
MGKASDFGLLVIRLGVGGACVAHGAQKLFGAFGGGGIKGTGAFFDSAGFVPGERNALLAGLCEAGGGALLALGLAAGPAGAAVAGNMIVASSTHVSNGFFAMGGGYELPATFGLVGAAIAVGGPGRYSIDALSGHALDKPWMRGVALASAVAAASYLIGERAKVLADRAAAAPPEAPETPDAA